MPEASQNKVAIITGAAGALGSELALLCARAAWETILVDKSQPGLARLYDRIVQNGGPEPSMVVLDFASMGPQDCQDIVGALECGPGRLDALIHCAASFNGLQPLDQIQPQDWLRHMQVNLNAPWLLSTCCLPLLLQAPLGSLYFISEDLEKVATAYWGAYGVSKHGIDALARQFAAELANTDIQVLALNPGPMRSPLRAKVYHTENPQDIESPVIAANKILQLMERRLPACSGLVQLEKLDIQA